MLMALFWLCGFFISQAAFVMVRLLLLLDVISPITHFFLGRATP
jgi:hypothetical protein